MAPSDISAYSIDEVLMDVTNYLPTYKLTPRELARKIVLDVLDTTGITATAGIGANLYLAKVAMDIWAKHTKPDKSGVRIAAMDEMSYPASHTAWRCGWLSAFSASPPAHPDPFFRGFDHPRWPGP